MPEFNAPRANPSPAAYGPYDVGIYPYLNQIAQQLAQAGRARQQAMAQAAAQRAQEEHRRQQLALAQDREARLAKATEALYGTPGGGIQGAQEPDIPGELGGATPPSEAGPSIGLRGQAQKIAEGRLAEEIRYHDLALAARNKEIAKRGGSGITDKQRLAQMDQAAWNQSGQAASRTIGGGSLLPRTLPEQAQVESKQYDIYKRTPGADPATVAEMKFLEDKSDAVLRQAAARHPIARVSEYAKFLLRSRPSPRPTETAVP